MQGSRFVLEPCNVRWRSLLRLRLRCPACLANRLTALRAGWRFSPASAGLENATAGSAASRSTKGALQCSLALTPTPAATLGDLSQQACELRKVPFESSPALAEMELTVSSLPCESPCGSSGRMAFFPSFSWLGKCGSRCGKPPTLMLQQATACLLSVLPCGSPLALRFSA